MSTVEFDRQRHGSRTIIHWNKLPGYAYSSTTPWQLTGHNLMMVVTTDVGQATVTMRPKTPLILLWKIFRSKRTAWTIPTLQTVSWLWKQDIVGINTMLSSAVDPVQLQDNCPSIKEDEKKNIQEKGEWFVNIEKDKSQLLSS